MPNSKCILLFSPQMMLPLSGMSSYQQLPCPVPLFPRPHLPLPEPPQISTSGSLSRNCSMSPTYTQAASTGSTEKKEFSRLLTPLGWPICGGKEKIVQLWITTSYRDLSGNITRKELWKKLNALKDWSINSALPITYKTTFWLTLHLKQIKFFYNNKNTLNFIITVNTLMMLLVMR